MPATSVYYTVLQSFQSQVTGLSLTLGSTVLPVKLRKLPKVDEDLDLVPCILICPSEKPERVEDASGEGHVYVRYGVQVVIVAANNQDYATNLDSYLSFREQIRRLFQGSTLAGAPTVYDLDAEPDPPIDRQAVNANYDYSALSFRVSSCELRGS